MCGVHDSAIRIGDADRACRRSFVDDIGRHGAEMGSAAAVGNRK